MVKTFGMDEMAALAGGSHIEEMAAFRPSTGPPVPSKQRPNEGPDLSTMSAAETAAMLMEKNAGKGHNVASSRYRTNKVLAHHALAKELSEELQQKHDQSQQQVRRLGGEESNEESEDDFVEQNQHQHATRRQRAMPQIIRRNEASSNTETRRTRRNLHDASSSDEESESKNRRRPMRREQDHGSSSNSSSSSDEEDRRRARLRASRKRQEPQIIQSVTDFPAAKNDGTNPEVPLKKLSNLPEDSSSFADKDQVTQKEASTKKQASTLDDNRGSSSSHEDSSTEDSSSSDSSSSSSEDEEMIAKPVFVPKHKRNLIQPEEKKWEEEELRNEREKKRAEKRKMESRALLAKTVAAVQASNVDDDIDEEGEGATNAPPNDDDDIDPEQLRDAWEVREMRRLLIAMDEMKKREKEKLEYERRRQMTDEEVLQHDMKVGRYQAPGSNRHGEPTGKFMQRFYHRGAFYMAEDEWEENDVRHKAAEYAKAVTGEDKIDKSVLPEVMQVKGFGRARQNTRYKGLAKEDTSDKRQELLPIIHKKK